MKQLKGGNRSWTTTPGASNDDGIGSSQEVPAPRSQEGSAGEEEYTPVQRGEKGSNRPEDGAA